MNAAIQDDSSFDATPDAAIEAIALHNGPVFVDLDETLYLRNSTEDFIDLARPGLLALLCLRALDFVKPWRWTGGDSTRDVWRVRLIWTVFPWTRMRWRARVARLAKEFANQSLVRALKVCQTHPIILTAGFQPIVKPLVVALGFPDAQIVAARLNSFDDRRLGKLRNAMQVLGPRTVGSGLFITDSMDDRTLLEQCARPLRTVWPEARFRRALGGIYLPGEYLTHVKRTGERYISRVILPEDLGFWMLASIGLAAHPLLHAIGLTFLLVSFWTIYERGYVDNDLAAAHFERNAKLSASFWQAPVATPRLLPWVWAFATGGVAVFLLRWPSATWLDFGKWVAVLLATYWVFHIYNRIDKSTRVWLFAALQFARSASLVVLVPISAIGAIALGAHILARWVPYYIYRLGAGHEWPEVRPKLVRVLFFLVLASLLGITQGAAVVLTWTAAALLAWNLFRARIELRALLSNIHRIDRDRDRYDAEP